MITFPALGPVNGTVSTDGRKADPDLVLTSSPRSTRLSDFVGGDPNGTWTLFLADLSSGGSARLDSWSLNFQTAIPEPAEVALAFGLGLLGWAVWHHAGRKV